MDFLDISEIKDGDEISVVKFQCGGCGHVFDTIPITQLSARRIGEICNKQCSCGNYSGFDFRENKPDTHDKLRELCTVLTEDLKHPATAETRWMIQTLLTGRNLKLRFAVKRAD
jgi:hypothetical protein